MTTEKAESDEARFNQIFFVRLLHIAHRYWWLTLIIAAVVASAAYMRADKNQIYESTSIVHSWYDPSSNNMINDRVAESLLNVISSSEAGPTQMVGSIQVEKIASTNFLRISLQARTAAQARASLEQALSVVLAAPAQDGTREEIVEKLSLYEGVLDDLYLALAAFESQLTPRPQEASGIEYSEANVAVQNLLSPVLDDILTTRRGVQDVLGDIRSMESYLAISRAGIMLLAPTMPLEPLPTRAAPTAMLFGIAALLFAAALAIAVAAVTAGSSMATARKRA